MLTVVVLKVEWRLPGLYQDLINSMWTTTGVHQTEESTKLNK